MDDGDRSSWIRSLLVLVFLVFLVVLILIVVFFHLDERDQRQRLAEQITFHAHPEAEHVVALDLGNRQWLAAGFQHHDIAGFQFHGFVLSS